MGEIPRRIFTTSFVRGLDAVDVMTVSGFAVLVAGTWLEFGAGYALIVSGLVLMGMGFVAMRGGL